MIDVTPIYGWGWSEGGYSIDTPKPFSVEVVGGYSDGDVIHGIISTMGHGFEGYYVQLKRSATLAHIYNVSGQIERGDKTRYISGSVQI